MWLLFGLGQLQMQRSCHLLLLKEFTGLMIQFPLVEHDTISNRACDDFQSWGVCHLRRPSLNFERLTNSPMLWVTSLGGWES